MRARGLTWDLGETFASCICLTADVQNECPRLHMMMQTNVQLRVPCHQAAPDTA